MTPKQDGKRTAVASSTLRRAAAGNRRVRPPTRDRAPTHPDRRTSSARKQLGDPGAAVGRGECADPDAIEPSLEHVGAVRWRGPQSAMRENHIGGVSNVLADLLRGNARAFDTVSRTAVSRVMRERRQAQ